MLRSGVGGGMPESSQPVIQMRLVVEATDFDEALRFYRDVLGRFFSEVFPAEFGEFAWEVIKESRVGAGTDLGYKITADRFRIAAHIDEDMRMIERRGRANTHEFPRMNANPGQSGVILEIGNGMSGHRYTPEQSFTVARL